MKHRSFVSLALVAAMGLGSMASASAETLKVSTFLPPSHTFNKMLALWSDELKEKSGGELSLEIFPAGQMGPPPRQFELVTAGAADMSVILHGATPGRFPMSELAGLPLSYPSAGQTSAITSRRLTELAPEYLAEEHAGTRIMWMAATPALKLHAKSADLSKVENLKGLRVRYAGTIWQQMVEAFGGSPLPVPPAETADALSKGIVDAASFPFEATKAFDLAPVVAYSTEEGLASATFAVVMSQAKYDSLSPELQKLIDDTTGPDRAEAFGKMWDEGEDEGRQYMIDGGVEIVSMSADEKAKLKALISPIVDSSVEAIEAKGKPAKAFVSAYTE